MRITVRAVWTASTSARSVGDETLANRWTTARTPGEDGATLLAAGCGDATLGADTTRVNAGAGRLATAGGARSGARSNGMEVRRRRAP